MGMFSYQCAEHGPFTKSLKMREKTAPCPSCQAESRAIIKVGSVQSIERLDNGVMTRAVERLVNIEEIMEERDLKFNPPKEEGNDGDA